MVNIAAQKDRGSSMQPVRIIAPLYKDASDHFVISQRCRSVRLWFFVMFEKSCLTLQLIVFTRDLLGGICSSLIGIAATGTSTIEAYFTTWLLPTLACQ